MAKRLQVYRRSIQYWMNYVRPRQPLRNYRYSGPKPQTKEAGIILLADSLEAATRSLTNPTATRIKTLETTETKTLETVIENQTLNLMLL